MGKKLPSPPKKKKQLPKPSNPNKAHYSGTKPEHKPRRGRGYKAPPKRSSVVTNDSEDREWLDKIRHARKRSFLRAIVDTCGNLTRASQIAGMVPQTHYNWLDGVTDASGMEDYQEAFQIAMELGNAKLESTAIQRATIGLRRLKFNSRTGQAYADPSDPTGRTPYEERLPSDPLLKFLMEGNIPKYRNLKLPPTTNVNVGVTTGVQFYLPDNGRGDAPHQLRAKREQEAIEAKSKAVERDGSDS